jgi:hypothetical protein
MMINFICSLTKFNSNSNRYKPRDNNYNKKAPVQLPMAPPTDTGNKSL